MRGTKTTTAAPLAAAILLLTPVLYVGSYYCLVDTDAVVLNDLRYRVCGEYCGTIFWPIEKIDRWLRPEAWKNPFEKLMYGPEDMTRGSRILIPPAPTNP
jgi:hypothetical protein